MEKKLSLKTVPALTPGFTLVDMHQKCFLTNDPTLTIGELRKMMPGVEKIRVEWVDGDGLQPTVHPGADYDIEISENTATLRRV